MLAMFMVQQYYLMIGLVLVLSIFMLAKNWKFIVKITSNREKTVLRDAIVIGKRIYMTETGVNYFYITYQFKAGEQVELIVSEKIYLTQAEGMEGLLVMKHGCLKSFKVEK